MAPPCYTQFAPYGNTFQGGVRVATGDITGNGVDDIVTAPGWSIVGQVRVYTEAGFLLTSFDPYGAKFKGGIQVAVGDVTGDGLGDIITVPSTGPALVKVFHPLIVNGVLTFNAAEPIREFLAFQSAFGGGAVVAAGDMGSTPVANGPFDTLLQDGKAEIIVGSGAGMKATVKVFDVSRMTTLTPHTVPKAAGSFTPFQHRKDRFQRGSVPRRGAVHFLASPGHLSGRRRQWPFDGRRLGVERQPRSHAVQPVGERNRLCRVHGC